MLRNLPVMKDGGMSPSEEPGVGIAIDWEAVEKLARRQAVITPEA
jgi:L-alanine-DL-glutamate epimerase-like enolase superfamily enzyme